MGVKYNIPLGDIDSDDLKGISRLIEDNEAIFEDFILNRFISDDLRYEYLEGSFSIDHIELDHFSFSAMVSHYAGCKDMSSQHDIEESISYVIIDNNITFELDDLQWDVR